MNCTSKVGQKTFGVQFITTQPLIFYRIAISQNHWHINLNSFLNDFKIKIEQRYRRTVAIGFGNWFPLRPDYFLDNKVDRILVVIAVGIQQPGS